MKFRLEPVNSDSCIACEILADDWELLVAGRPAARIYRWKWAWFWQRDPAPQGVEDTGAQAKAQCERRARNFSEIRK